MGFYVEAVFLETISQLLLPNFADFHKIGSEAVAQRCSVKKVFLEISQNSQENTCARVSVVNTEHLRCVLL